MSDEIFTYLMDPDKCIQQARTDYVFFGKDLLKIEEEYQIPKEVLGELAFVGKDSWRSLRAKVEEDELDGLINTNMYILKKSLNGAISRVQEFMETDEAKKISTWDDVSKVMGVIKELTKAAEVSKRIQDHRLPGKMKKIAKKDGVPMLESELEEENEQEEFDDEYSKPSREELLEEQEEEDFSDALDTLI